MAFTYSYQNDQNESEDFWVTGANTGSGSEYVAVDSNNDGVIDATDCDFLMDVGAGCRGSGAGVVKFEGITIDIGELPDGSGTPAIAIGLPKTVTLNRVNTGDYFIAHANPSDLDAPPIAIDETSDRKLVGLKWNTPPPLNFDPENVGLPARASDVVNNNFSNDLIRMEGQIYIFAN